MKIKISHHSLVLPDQIMPSSYWLGHLPFAFWLTENLKPSTFIELGVHTGASYFAFCQAVKNLNLQTKCFGIDSFVGDAHYGEYSSEVLKNVLSYHQPRYSAFSTIIQSNFSDALDNFDDGSIDLLHIDGTHFYDDVKRDFEQWLPKLATNGVILFHDTNVHTMDFGVHRLWNEITPRYKHFEFLHCNGLGVLFLGDEYPEEIRPFFTGSDEEKNLLREFFSSLGSRCQEKAISQVAQEKLEKATADLDYFTNENGKIKSAYEKTAADLNHLRVENEKTAADLNYFRDENGKIKSEYEKIAADLNYFRDESLKVKEEHGKLLVNQKSLELMVSGLENQKSELLEQKSSLENQNASISIELAEAAEQSKELINIKNLFQSELESLRSIQDEKNKVIYESQTALNSILAEVTAFQAESGVAASILGSNRIRNLCRSSRHELQSWKERFGFLLGPNDLFAHSARSSWLAAYHIITHIRRKHLFKPLAKVSFFNQVKSVAEVGDNLIAQDPVAAAARYLTASRETHRFLNSQRKTWWKRLFIKHSWLDALQASIDYAEICSLQAGSNGPSENEDPGSTEELASEKNIPSKTDNQTLSRLETKYPGITVPRAISNTRSLEAKLKTPAITRVSRTGRSRMNFLFPDLDADIVFGGYIAALEFAAAMSLNFDIRLITTAHSIENKDALLEKFKSNPRIRKMLMESELEALSNGSPLSVSSSDFFCAYSVWDGIIAHNLAAVCGQSTFISFCQEDESTFHSHDFCHAITRYSQLLPQFAVFNTSILQDYFRHHRLGVYNKGLKKGDSNSLAFEHALVQTAPASPADYKSRKVKRILIYTRPEDHAKRNLFEFALLGLDLFLKNNAIKVDEVELVGVGTLEFQSDVPVGKGHKLKIQPKLDLGDYAKSLASFDIGLSLMYAPHPSILPYEMASAGLVVVTNTFGIRDEKTISSISKNLVPVEPNIESIAHGLTEAWKKSDDYNSRIENSVFNWPRDWNETFSDKIIDRLGKAANKILNEAADFDSNPDSKKKNL